MNSSATHCPSPAGAAGKSSKTSLPHLRPIFSAHLTPFPFPFPFPPPIHKDPIHIHPTSLDLLVGRALIPQEPLSRPRRLLVRGAGLFERRHPGPEGAFGGLAFGSAGAVGGGGLGREVPLQSLAPFGFHFVEFGLRCHFVTGEGVFGGHDFDVTPGFLVGGDGGLGEGVVFRVPEDDVEFAEALEVDDGPFGEPLDEEVVVLPDVVVVGFSVRSVAFPFFASLQDTEAGGTDDGSIFGWGFIVPLVAHEAVVVLVGGLEKPVDLCVDVREDLYAASEDVFPRIRICVHNIEKPFTNTWPDGKLPSARCLSRDVNTTEPHDDLESLARLVQDERFSQK